MEQRKYDHTTAKAIFEMIGWPESWVIRDDGVFVEDGFRFHSPREQAFDWTPAYDMDWPGAPNPMTAPTLPIEFTARELAASMIDGVGRQIQDALNRRIGYALDDAALQDFGSYHSWVRDALTEAYDVARQAQDVVGELDHDQQQRAYDLLAQYDKAYGQALEREKVMEREIIGKHKNGNPEYGGFIATGDEYLLRLARAKESVAVQKAQAEQAKEQADAALKAWRKAMVRQLLQPQATTSPASAPPVVAGSASDTPATQDNIMQKKALIAALEHEWPSIEADISDAARNGLKAAAHTGKHGDWNENKARAWAVSKGKIKQAAPVHHLTAAWPGATTRHTISR